jgi:uncharacterized membrane protein YgcG
MADGHSSPSLADYVGIAIAPALIMSLVGSLVYFIVEVLLGPECPGQLLWILFFFVLGAVLVARISMTVEIADRAALYGAVLGIAAWIGMLTYVKYPAESKVASFDWLIDAFLIGIVWWSAHKLTWDSTLIDDEREASGAGLIQEAGLDAENPAPDQSQSVPKRGSAKKENSGLAGWFSRYRKYCDEAGKRPHAPGVWIVYFSLAALPLFGLGQSLIPPAELGRRQYAFWLMTIYVASGLSLLLTTSFLNLRRYLRQRNVKMPVAMAGMWLTIGGGVIVTLLVLGAFLPRPNAEYPLIDLAGQVSPHDREGSAHALGEGWAKKGDDPRAGSRKTNAGSASGKEKGATGAGQGEHQTVEGERKNTEGGKSGDQSGKSQSGKGGGQSGGGKNDDRQAKNDPKQSDPGKGPSEPGAQNASPSGRPTLAPEMGTTFASILKWIVGILVALVLLFFLGRALLRFLANFTTWSARLLKSLQKFWERLASLWRSPPPEALLNEPRALAPPPPFAAFPDPFLTGQAETLTPAQLATYAFEALESWAWEQKVARHGDETPLEFSHRLGDEFPALEGAVRDVAALYASVAYARRSPSIERLQTLRPLWSLLTEVSERPLTTAASGD